MVKFPQNKILFDDFKKLNLPIGHYAITSSGPMGIRDIRAIGDVDIICVEELWDELAAKYKVVIESGISKIHITDNIEALGPGSFYCDFDTDAPNVDKQIRQSELIDGLPFVNLKHVIYFKDKLGRDKDKKDIELINAYLVS